MPTASTTSTSPRVLEQASHALAHEVVIVDDATRIGDQTKRCHRSAESGSGTRATVVVTITGGTGRFADASGTLTVICQAPGPSPVGELLVSTGDCRLSRDHRLLTAVLGLAARPADPERRAEVPEPLAIPGAVSVSTGLAGRGGRCICSRRRGGSERIRR